MNSNIYLLRGKIETNPEVIADIDWRKETNGFEETMLDELVMSIDDDELNELVRKSIANQWYLATNNASWPIADCDFDLTKMYDDGYGRSDRGYRYNIDEDNVDYHNSIEEHLGASNEKRIKKRKLEKTNNLLQKKALEFARKKKSAIQPTEPQQVCEEDKAMKEKVEELTLELRKKQEAIDSLKQQLEDANALISSLNQKIEDLNNLDDELNSNDKRRLDFGLTTGTWAAIANGLALFGTNYTKEKIAVALHDFTGRSAQRIRTETPSSKDIDKAKEFLQNIKNKI